MAYLILSADRSAKSWFNTGLGWHIHQSAFSDPAERYPRVAWHSRFESRSPPQRATVMIVCYDTVAVYEEGCHVFLVAMEEELVFALVGINTTRLSHLFFSSSSYDHC